MKVNTSTLYAKPTMKAIAMNDRISWIVFIGVWVMPYFLAISGGWDYNFVTFAFAMSVPFGSTMIVTNDWYLLYCLELLFKDSRLL